MSADDKWELQPDEDETLQRIINGTFRPQSAPEKRAELMGILASVDNDQRIEAIIGLGEVGDAETLAALRLRLDSVGQEYQALIIAIGTLKWRLGEE